MNQRQQHAERPNRNARRNKLRQEAQIKHANLGIEKVRQQATFQPQRTVRAPIFLPTGPAALLEEVDANARIINLIPK